MRAVVGVLGAAVCLFALDLLLTHHGGGMPVRTRSYDALAAFHVVWAMAGGLATLCLLVGLRPLEGRIAAMEGSTRPMLVAGGVAALAALVVGGPTPGVVLHVLTAVGVARLIQGALGSSWAWCAGVAWALVPGALLAVAGTELSLVASLLIVGALLWLPELVAGVVVAVVVLGLGGTLPNLDLWVALGEGGRGLTRLAAELGWPVGVFLAPFCTHSAWGRAAVLGGIAGLLVPEALPAVLLPVFLASVSGLAHLGRRKSLALLVLLAMSVVTTVGYTRHRVITEVRR